MTAETRSAEKTLHRQSITAAVGGAVPDPRMWRSFGVDLPLRLTAEILDFAGRRLHAQAEHLQALARCGTPADAFKLQVTFVSHAMSDYQQESGRLSQSVADAASPPQAPKAT
ncbi:phasin family protein [Methylobacterium nodulans]|uniref:Phasin domain-containing protein n=1 Tax=Methylobacterium nodulans (strain LMG 21967 / CNCM I-2342 / ORS 2060) TaxID=460265 RepID=B8IMN5_METNO|nr:phasin family protein [Methylobacterium nodulans]ACL60228.1 hypothetical protein Mnod_5383 [Methylobacterium nodulans ORS 2060]